MFGKKKPQVAPAEDGAEARAKARRKKVTRLPKGVKQLIGYDAMLRNGIASLGDGRWSATILFQDINYQLSPESHQMEIIDRWAKLINSFEAGQNVQIASYTRSRGVREILADVMMDETGDSLDHYRLDYNRLAQGKLESVSRNTSTVKTLTVTVRESDEQAAVATLNALCNNLVSQMRSIDACKATRLDREHRLRLMAEVLRPGEEFRFDERRFEHQPGKPDTKDLVCPWSIDARNPTMLDIESLDSKYLHRTMWVSSLPPELSDQLVNDLTGLRARVDVSIHLAPMDRGESMTLVRRKNAEVKMQIMDQRRKNRKQGLDPDDLPDDLADQQEQLGQLRDELRSTNQRLVDSIIVIGVSAASQEELEVACRNVKAKVNAQSCTAESLKFMQMEGLTAELPLGNNPLPMKRTLTTNSAAILIPFTTQEVFEPHGLFYGSNARSGNPILADRRSHMNSNGFVLGTSGGGKSFTVKQEIAGMFLNRDDEVITKTPDMTPSIHLEKVDTPTLKQEGQEQADRDDSKQALKMDADSIGITFIITNTSKTDPATGDGAWYKASDLNLDDSTIVGDAHVDMDSLTYPDNWDTLVLKPGESVSVTGTLKGVKEGETHTDRAIVTGTPLVECAPSNGDPFNDESGDGIDPEYSTGDVTEIDGKQLCADTQTTSNTDDWNGYRSKPLASTGTAVLGLAGGALAVLLAGGSLLVFRKRHYAQGSGRHTAVNAGK